MKVAQRLVSLKKCAFTWQLGIDAFAKILPNVLGQGGAAYVNENPRAGGRYLVDEHGTGLTQHELRVVGRSLRAVMHEEANKVRFGRRTLPYQLATKSRKASVSHDGQRCTHFL